MNKHIVLIEHQMFFEGYKIIPRLKRLGYTVTMVFRDVENYVKEFPIKNRKNPLFFVDQIINTETNSMSNLEKIIEKIDKFEKIDAILSFSDYYLETACELSEKFGLINEKSQTIRKIKNKQEQYDMLANKQIRVPQTIVLNSVSKKIPNNLCYPSIIKPSCDSGSHFVEKISSREDLENYLKKVEHRVQNERDQHIEPIYLYQEFIEGIEFSVEYFTENGKHHFIGITSKTIDDKHGFSEKLFSFPVKFEKEEEKTIQDFCIKTLNALNISFGCSHIEIKKNDNGLCIIEVNPRLGGRYISKMIYDTRGINLFLEEIKYATTSNYSFPELLDTGGAAYNVLYPMKKGRVRSELNYYEIKEKRVKVTLQDGKHVNYGRDNSDAYGYIYSYSENTLDALDNVISVESDLEDCIYSEEELNQ